MRKIIIVSAVVASGVLLGGCGRPDSSATQQPTSPSTSTAAAKPAPVRTPNPPPHVLTRGEAGKAYEAMVKPSNAAGFALGKQVAGKTASQISLTKVKAAAASCVAASRASIVTASTTLWPANIRSDMADVIKVMGEDVSLCSAITHARSTSDVLDIWNTPTGTSTSAAEVIRAKLGLPPAPTG